MIFSSTPKIIKTLQQLFKINKYKHIVKKKHVFLKTTIIIQRKYKNNGAFDLTYMVSKMSNNHQTKYGMIVVAIT